MHRVRYERPKNAIRTQIYVEDWNLKPVAKGWYFEKGFTP